MDAQLELSIYIENRHLHLNSIHQEKKHHQTDQLECPTYPYICKHVDKLKAKQIDISF